MVVTLLLPASPMGVFPCCILKHALRVFVCLPRIPMACEEVIRYKLGQDVFH